MILDFEIHSSTWHCWIGIQALWPWYSMSGPVCILSWHLVLQCRFLSATAGGVFNCSADQSFCLTNDWYKFEKQTLLHVWCQYCIMNVLCVIWGFWTGRCLDMNHVLHLDTIPQDYDGWVCDVMLFEVPDHASGRPAGEGPMTTEGSSPPSPCVICQQPYSSHNMFILKWSLSSCSSRQHHYSTLSLLYCFNEVFNISPCWSGQTRGISPWQRTFSGRTLERYSLLCAVKSVIWLVGWFSTSTWRTPLFPQFNP